MQETSGLSGDGVIRVLIVDDHAMVREGLRAVLEPLEDIEVVGDAGTVTDAIRQIEMLHPDVGLIDIKLPDGSGIEICRAIRETAPGMRCLVLTSLAEDEALFEAVLAGAAGYVLKQVRTAELLACIRRVAGGGTLVDDRAARRIRERAASGDADPLISQLSPQERRLLALLAEGMTNRQIAEEMLLAEKTVKNYVSRLMMKMDMTSRSQAAVYGVRASERRQFSEPDPGNPIRY